MQTQLENPSNRLRIVATLFCIAQSLSGCMAPQRVQDSLRPTSNFQQLSVLHVLTDVELRAGTPLDDGYQLLTAGTTQSRAVVEGLPAYIDEYTMRDLLNVHATPPRCVLFRSFRFGLSRNVINWQAPIPEVGEELVIAGFFRPQSADPVSFFHTPCSQVIVRIAPPPEALDVPQKRFYLAAPPGDYSGFIGGPVAQSREEGGFEVIGLIEAQVPVPQPLSNAMLRVVQIVWARESCP